MAIYSRISSYFLVVVLISLLLSPNLSQPASLTSVSSISEVVMGDGLASYLGNRYCEGSMMGGFYATILLNGAISSPQDEATIVFTFEPDQSKVVEIPYINTENPYLTGSDSNRITFVAPHIGDIEPNWFPKYSYLYNVSLKIKDKGMVGCASHKACQINYVFSRTPFIWSIFNPVSISGMYSIQRIQFQLASDIRKQNIPLRHISMEGFKCDYTTNSLITDKSAFDRHSTRQYVCAQTFSQPVLNNAAKLQTRTYSGDGYIPASQYTYTLDGGFFSTRILPSITSVSAHSGSKDGGHLLTIKGKAWLLETAKTSFTINGSINCQVKSLTKDQSSGEFTATCETNASAVISGSAFVGGQGWKHQIYTGIHSIDGVKDASPPKVSNIKTLLFNSEIVFNNFQATGAYVSRSRAFFKAPKSGNYYIWYSGDDSIKVYFSKTASTIPSTWNDSTDLVVNLTHATGFRDIWSTWDAGNSKFTKRSERIDGLVQDNYYYIEMFHGEIRGADHATIGLQIQNSTIDSPRKLPQVQRIEFRAQPNLDQYTVTLYWGSDHSSPKSVDIKFYNKNSRNQWEQTVISDIIINSSAVDFHRKVEVYFNKYFNRGWNHFHVEKTMYSDESGTTTLVQGDAVIVEFKIYMKKARSQPREQAIKLPTLASSTIDLSKSQIRFRAGQPGLSGEWQLQIVSSSGQTIQTGASYSNLGPGATAWHVNKAIWDAVPEYYLRVFVIRRDLYNTDPQQSFAGHEYIITYDQVRVDVPQLRAINVDMSYGNSGAKTPTFASETIQPFSDDLFFFPAPYEFFFTPHEKPQIQVTVDSHLGACDWTSETTCDYEFVDEAPEITSISSSSPFTSLTIGGTTLGTSADEYQRLEWAGRKCTAVVTSTSISCTVTDPVAGSHVPVANSKAKGKVKQTGLSPIVIAPTLTGVSPSSVNDQGGQVVTLTGTRFPDSAALGTHTTGVTVAGVACTKIQLVSKTQLRCTTGASMPTGSQDVVLTINGQSVTSSGSISINGLGSTSATISPNKMNATEKDTLTVVVTGLNQDLTDTTKFDVKLVSANHIVRMRTFQQSYTTGTNTLKVKFPGGKIGDYTLVVDHDDKGTLSDGSQSFRVGAKITAISVNQGSLYGGTQITITGELFHPTQSIIKVGRNDCKVKGQITKTSITCITPPTRNNNIRTGALIDSAADVAVVINLTQDATCSVSPNCLFSWKDSLTPKVTDTAWSDNVLTITGTGFGTTKSDVKVELSDLEQQVDTVSSTQIVITANNIKTRGSKLKLRVRINPKGYALIPKANYEHNAPSTITYTALSPSSNASQGGQKLTLTGTGFASDIVAHLKDKDSSTKVCDSVTYVSFTELICYSNTGIMNFSGTTLIIGSKSLVCTSCSISTALSSPTLTTIADGGYSGNDQTLNLTGTDFPTGGETIVAVKVSDSISSSSATINSATSISAVFTGGIGFGTDLKIQSIEFSNGSFAKIDSGAKITLSLSGTATSNLNCSFAGGCLWKYDQTNVNRLASSLSATVCGLPCTHDSTESTDNSYKCRAPVMATKRSISTYTNLISSKSWQHFNQPGQSAIVTVYSNNPASFGAEAFDNDVSNQTGTGQASCYLGLQITGGNHVGTIDSIRYFFPRTLNADKYVGGKFEVSNDGGSTWTTLFTIEKNPMQGWNGWDRVSAGATSGAMDTFNAVKYSPPAADSRECNFMEIEIKGKVVRSDNTNTVTCPVVLKRGEETLATEASGIIYNESNTPKITSLSKKNISANGGESVTITGTGFSGGALIVTIDGIVCTSPTAGGSGTTISCTTGMRAAPSVQPFTVEVGTNGYAANQGNKFLYVLNWSDPDAWSGEYGPVDGDSISIPAGQNLVFDIDKGPLLKALIVEGSLLFYPDSTKTHKRTFDAEYVFVRGGLLQIGTQSEPYDSYLTITMHGTKKSAEIPIYGNKVIAVRDGGILQMHGEAKTPSWTDLYTTADVGATTMQLNIDNTAGDKFNWQVGDVMVLAPTDFDFREAEEITITAVTNQNANNRPQVTFTPALKYKHYAGKQTFTDGSFIEMRAEVGVLTHKVKYQGDENSQDNQYGAHIMLHSPGDQSVEGRIENIELTQVGQAFQLGRYPLHFHMIGRVTKSYIKNNAIHHTYNRACTLHGVHYLTIQGNVAYYTMGHTFFIEDAAETKNRLIRNLAIRSEPSNSLLNTDQSPASFWITHPDNIFRDNHAAGSARYGFWFDMQNTAIGPSYDPNICPPGERLGQFNGNVAHSNGRYGLRIFHFHIPRTHPCKPVSVEPAQNSATPQDDAFAQNPPIPAVYENYTGYKNNRNGIITQQIGAVQFRNIKTADNLQAGVETTIPGFAKLDQGFLDGAVIVGMSENAGDLSRYTNVKGIIAGQRDTFTYKNVKFHNFDQNISSNSNAAISTCSHCTFILDDDSIANTSSFQGLTFNSVTKKIIYDASRRNAILHDVDGSLSGAGAERWITPSLPHHKISGVCTEDSTLDNSAVCSSPVRKLIFNQPVKDNQMKGQRLKIALLSDFPAIPAGQDDITWTPQLHSKFSEVKDTKSHWDVPIVIGQQYNVHWQYGIDWQEFSLKRSRFFKATDPGFTLRFNYTDRRDEFNVQGRAKVQNITTANTVLDYATPSNTATHRYGAHINDIPKKHWTILINSKPYDQGLNPDSSLRVTTKRCSFSCTHVAKTNVDNTTRRWSVPTDWEDVGDAPGSGKVPLAGQQVTIKGNWNMIYDIESANAVELKKLFINGRLTFASEPSKHYELKSQWIIVEAGQLIIGQEQTPYPAKATITLLGTRNQDAYAYSNDIIAGNKIIFVTGKLFINGGDIIEGGKTHSKLLMQGSKNSKALKVEPGLNWKAGHKIVIAPSSYDYKQHELKEIETYNSSTGDLTITTPLQYNHYGAATAQTYDSFTYDLRTQVGHLTRNVVIQGEENQRWGGQIFVSEFQDKATETVYAGTATLRNVQFKRMSQYDTQSAAIRTFQITQKPVIIDRCSFQNTPAWAFNIIKSKNITLSNNVVYQTYRNAIKVHGVDVFRMMNNLFILNIKRQFDQSISLKDHQVAVDLCTGQNANTCKNMLVQNNVVAGAQGIGFLIPASDCNNQLVSQEWFKNNKVHSAQVGMIPGTNSASGSSCGLLKNFQAHHNYVLGITSQFGFSKLVLKNVKIIDNAIGLKAGIGSGTNAQIVLEDSLIIGEHTASRDCSISYERGGGKKIGMYSSIGLASHGVPFTYPPLGFFTHMGNPGRGKTMTIKNVVFKDFPDPSSRCNNGEITTFHTNTSGSDLIMPHIFRNVKYDGVSKKSFIFLMNPPEGWANLTDCVDFPCTAPQNLLLQFREGYTDTSNALGLISVPFDIIANNPGVNNGLGTCSFISEWNSNLCEGDTRALLQFESLDNDKFDRSYVPLNVVNPSIPSFNNTLNSFMDHVWDGFYTGQTRLSRFISIVRTDTSDLTEILFTGTPPLSQLFQLYATQSKSQYLKVKIDYPKPEAVRVKLGNTEIPQQNLQNGVPAPLTGTSCGQNRWVPVQNILEFTIMGDPSTCSLTLVTKQSIQLTFRIEMTVTEFFTFNHQATFVSRLSASLGIPTYRVKVVGVTAGSVVVHSQIEEDQTPSNEADKITEINSLSQKLNSMMTQGSALGDWKVLDFSMTVRAHQGGKISNQQTPEKIVVNQAESKGLSIGIIVVIVVGSVVFVTAVVLVIVIILRRRKGKVVFKATNGEKEGAGENVLFQKSMNNLHPEDAVQTDRATEHGQRDSVFPARMDTGKIQDIQ